MEFSRTLPASRWSSHGEYFLDEFGLFWGDHGWCWEQSFLSVYILGVGLDKHSPRFAMNSQGVYLIYLAFLIKEFPNCPKSCGVFVGPLKPTWLSLGLSGTFSSEFGAQSCGASDVLSAFFCGAQRNLHCRCWSSEYHIPHLVGGLEHEFYFPQ